MTTYGLLSDVHATRHAPASCTDSYLPDLLGLLKQALGVFRERRTAASIVAGDLFHHKAPSRSDHYLVRELAELFRDNDVWVLPGNHDMQNDRPSSVSVTQPLGVLYSAGVAHCLDGWMGSDHPVFGVPWQQHWSEEGIAECLRPWNEQLFARSLVVTHAPLYPPGSEPRYEGAELTPADWWAGPLEDGSMGHGVFYGHIHEPHGTWERRGVRFCNNGALSRGSLDEYNLERQVGVTLWDSSTGEFEFVPLDARPASEVFRLREHEQVVTAKMSLDEFMAGLDETVLPRLDPAAVLARFREQGVPRDELDLAEELLDWAGAEGKPKK
jgi:DNA repair exonuclease SbcCD nuclease subunit